MRLLTGPIEAVGTDGFRIPGLQLRIPNARTLLRPATGDDSQRELLLVLELEAGTNTQEIDYELLR